LPVLPAGEIDDDGEQLLIERAREGVLPQAPARCEPVAGDEEDDRFAARRRLVQRPLPALARRDAALGVEIEEDVVPTLGRQPIAQRHRLEIVGAGMAEEDARHRGSRRSPEGCYEKLTRIAQRRHGAASESANRPTTPPRGIEPTALCPRAAFLIQRRAGSARMGRPFPDKKTVDRL
jgi:hypothetical protein